MDNLVRQARIAGTLVLGAMGLAPFIGVGPVGAQTPTPVPFSQASFSAYSTGTLVHVGALKLGTTQVANVEEGFSGASVAGKGGTSAYPGQGPSAATGTIVNEMSQVVQPALPATGTSAKLAGNHAFGRGSGLEVGLLGTTPVTTNAVPVNKVQVSAPPSTSDDLKIGPINVPGIASATLLEGQASANYFADNSCVVGAPISQGLGKAADAQVLPNAAGAVVSTSAPAPNDVAQSLSQTVVAPQTTSGGASAGPNVGLLSQTSEILAPVTLLKGTPSQITIQVAGVFSLQAVAGGVPGSAYIHYGPGSIGTNTSPVLSVLNAAGQIIQQLTSQQLLGQAGLTLPIANIATISVGQAPRAINGAIGSAPQVAADGTSASAAVDVATVQLLNNPTLGINAADIRIGHMESKAQVPSGGLSCSPIPITKTANPSTVNPGQQFTYDIAVTNPCLSPLTGVKLVDTINAPAGVKFSVLSENPKADSVSPDNTTITFNDIGPIPARSTETVTIQVQVAQDSAAGVLTDTVNASGSCGTGVGIGTQTVAINVGLNGTLTVMTPNVNGAKAAVQPQGTLAFTGEQPWIPMAGSGAALLAIGGLLLRRRVRHS